MPAVHKLDPHTGRPPECHRNATLTDIYERLGQVDARLERIEGAIADLAKTVADGFADLAREPKPVCPTCNGEACIRDADGELCWCPSCG